MELYYAVTAKKFNDNDWPQYDDDWPEYDDGWPEYDDDWP